jgi:hypothetical protein
VCEALEAIDQGERAVMVVGRAGTGKTTLVHYLRRRPGGERQVVLAPTGVAALNAGGQTINSFFQIRPGLIGPDGIKSLPRLQRAFQKLERVVIDEISMVRADLLDAVDRSLRVNRVIDEPFGGVRMLFVGDFLQLPPVVPPEERAFLSRLGYRTPYAFSARSFQAVPVAPIELTIVHRQEDKEFVELLSRLRLGDRVEETISVLNACCCRPPRQGSEPVRLTPTNARADYYNCEGLRKLPGEVVGFQGAIKGRFNVQRDRLPAPERLVLKVGARVMAVKNDRAKRWVNGSLGTVTRLTDDRAWVQFDRDGAEVEVDRVEWENIRFEWDDEAQCIISKVIGSYTQIPLIPAWAITINKAQGLTLDDVQVDLDSGAFAPGQAYVALSRATSLEGLSLVRPIRPADVRVDPELIEFGKWLQRETIAASDRTPGMQPTILKEDSVSPWSAS